MSSISPCSGRTQNLLSLGPNPTSTERWFSRPFIIQLSLVNLNLSLSPHSTARMNLRSLFCSHLGCCLPTPHPSPTLFSNTCPGSRARNIGNELLWKIMVTVWLSGPPHPSALNTLNIDGYHTLFYTCMCTCTQAHTHNLRPIFLLCKCTSCDT